MRSKKTDEFFNAALSKMFKMVGFKDFDKDFTKQKEWYTLKTWSEEKRELFKSWFFKEATTKMKWSKKATELEFSYFDLMWGWKIEDCTHQK
jgi:hypothetical protein